MDSSSTFIRSKKKHNQIYKNSTLILMIKTILVDLY